MVFGCIKTFISRKIGKVLNNSETKIFIYEFLDMNDHSLLLPIRFEVHFEIILIDEIGSLMILKIHNQYAYGSKRMTD